MPNSDTIELLKECNSGIKMGVNTIDEVCEKVSDSKFKALLEHCKEEHQHLGSKTHELLNEYHDSEKNPNPMARTMSWFKTNIMISMNDDDETIADLVTDGCNMGVKSLYKYMNKYKAADDSAKDIAKELIHIEENLTKDLRQYL